MNRITQEAHACQRYLEYFLKHRNATEAAIRYRGNGIPLPLGDILDSVTYTGDMILQKTYKDSKFNTRRNEGQYPLFYAEEHHPPIIDHSTYEAVKEMREARRKHARKAGVVKHTFTSVLTCGCCGASLNRQKNRCGNVYWI